MSYNKAVTHLCEVTAADCRPNISLIRIARAIHVDFISRRVLTSLAGARANPAESRQTQQIDPEESTIAWDIDFSSCRRGIAARVTKD